MILADKKSCSVWVKRLHLSLRAYQELLQTMLAMDKCTDQSVKESSKVIKSNIFYVLEYREFILQITLAYDDTKMPKYVQIFHFFFRTITFFNVHILKTYFRSYLKDLLETVHLFLKMLEHFCNKHSLVVQKKIQSKRNKKSNALNMYTYFINYFEL